MIEVIAYTVDDAKRIEQCGADRVELVSAASEGGLTPSYGMIEKVVTSVSIPVNVMIRPHSRSFCYTKEEIEVMKRDIKVAKELGANGAVLGVLKSGRVDEKVLEELLKECDGLDVTFHRAIDEAEDVLSALGVIKKYERVTEVLTSGGKGDILKNAPVIKKMVENSGRIRIIVGGGLTFENIARLIEITGAKAYHFGRAVRRNNSYFEEIEEEKLTRMVNLIKGMVKGK
ncbi:copper homeostasis protein [Caldanaerovirga acetigignens]|uniref:PF03932 family protein CutC n=1 Tax=Caldanaerovirga acetigignens TaxID=447595 RepID=A0A1M7MD49_9FIRM|nr:copper homeostasis protein CutC [Caldanaerovirga acetigignens]SHM88744.1 copper homeostasis protein [Caldanaerovirga acetigignens]